MRLFHSHSPLQTICCNIRKFLFPFLLHYYRLVNILVAMLFFVLSPIRSRGSGVTVAVLLSWEPPREGDLPVHNYRVTWMPRHAHAPHKQTHTLHVPVRGPDGSLYTRPSSSRSSEQGKKETNSRLTQGVRNSISNSITLNENECDFITFSSLRSLLRIRITRSYNCTSGEL